MSGAAVLTGSCVAQVRAALCFLGVGDYAPMYPKRDPIPIQRTSTRPASLAHCGVYKESELCRVSLLHYVLQMDVFVESRGADEQHFRAWVTDIEPCEHPTDPLLFCWAEIDSFAEENECGAQLSMRLVPAMSRGCWQDCACP